MPSAGTVWPLRNRGDAMSGNQMALEALALRVAELETVDFIAIDTETANSSRSSLCSVGVALVAGGQVVAEAEQTINPDCEFNFFNTRVNGLDAESVAGSPTLPVIWDQLTGICADHDLVFHNAAFDVGVLRASAARHSLPGFTGSVSCSMRLARRVWPTLPGYGLAVLGPQLGLSFDHHRAGSDARACAEVVLALLKSEGVGSLRDLHIGLETTPGALGENSFTGMAVLTDGSGLRNRVADPGADPDAPLHDLTVCFTGTLVAMIRRDAADLVCASGGAYVQNMSAKVDILVVGDGDYIAFADGHQTGKLLKAAKLRAEGLGPEIMREADFFRLTSAMS